MTSPIIDIQGLTWSYPQTHEKIFDNFYMKIEKQDFCFIIGKSGVGKTTLVKFLTRQLKPPKKMIFHKKEDIARFNVSEVQAYRRKIGVVYQDFKLIERKNVGENIIYPLEITGTKYHKKQKKLNHILDALDLKTKKNSNVLFLSGGEKQRVAIGRALINDPEFIIADEPTGNLDREASIKIANTLIHLNKKGNTIVVITHNFSLVEYVQNQCNVKVIELK